jgi:hypothetical protein
MLKVTLTVTITDAAHIPESAKKIACTQRVLKYHIAAASSCFHNHLHVRFSVATDSRGASSRLAVTLDDITPFLIACCVSCCLHSLTQHSTV